MKVRSHRQRLRLSRWTEGAAHPDVTRCFVHALMCLALGCARDSPDTPALAPPPPERSSCAISVDAFPRATDAHTPTDEWLVRHAGTFQISGSIQLPQSGYEASLEIARAACVGGDSFCVGQRPPSGTVLVELAPLDPYREASLECPEPTFWLAPIRAREGVTSVLSDLRFTLGPSVACVGTAEDPSALGPALAQLRLRARDSSLTVARCWLDLRSIADQPTESERIAQWVRSEVAPRPLLLAALLLASAESGDSDVEISAQLGGADRRLSETVYGVRAAIVRFVEQERGLRLCDVESLSIAQGAVLRCAALWYLYSEGLGR